MIGAARERYDGGCPRPGRPVLKAKRRTPGVSSKSFGAKKWVRRSLERSVYESWPWPTGSLGRTELQCQSEKTRNQTRERAVIDVVVVLWIKQSVHECCILVL